MGQGGKLFRTLLETFLINLAESMKIAAEPLILKYRLDPD